MEKTNFAIVKKLLLAISSVFYLAISTGLVFSLHYCMGNLAGVKLEAVDAGKSCVCGAEEKENACCETEYRIVKLEQDQKQSVVPIFDSVPFETEISVFFHLNDIHDLGDPQYRKESCNGPPLVHQPPVYLRNRVFRI